MKRAATGAVVVVMGAFAGVAPAGADNGVEHLHYVLGPYVVAPGTNQYVVDLHGVPKPNVNGFMVRAAQNIHYPRRDGSCCGPVPRVDIVHLHHAVWLSTGAAGVGEGNGYGPIYPFMAVGEEKTAYQFPPGTGYPVGANDHWYVLRMLHNQTRTPQKLYITYDIDFIPDSSPAARGITPIHPIWMDVMDHNIYPVFDVLHGSGVNGKYTFPDMATNPYGSGPPRNEFTVDHPGTLVATAGHVHPGGLYDDLDLIRAGATPGAGTIAGPVPSSVRLFRSNAHYFDPRGPVSWDLAMTGSAPDWRPHLNAGDVLRISATYDTQHGSWYEVMGIMVAWEMRDDQIGLDPFTGQVAPTARVAGVGVDPFANPVDQKGYTTHGRLPENRFHGGTPWLKVKPSKLPSCMTNKVDIAAFTYFPGDLQATGKNRCAPTVKQGQSITFFNADASPLPAGIPGISPTPAYFHSIFHTITVCRQPCTARTGVSYPLTNGPVNFDSGELGDGSPAIGRLTWSTAANLRPGTYTFYCRIHPFMRGVFRVIK